MMVGALGASMEASAQDSPCVGVGPASWIAVAPTSAQPLPQQDPESAGDDELIWDNGDSEPGLSLLSQLDLVYPFESGAADDFLIRDQLPNAVESASVTRIDWLGYIGCGEYRPLEGVRFFFYENAVGADREDGGDAPTGGPEDPTDTAIYSAHLDPGEFIEVRRDDLYIEFSAELPTPFEADVDTLYWLEIQGVLEFPPKYFWTSNDSSYGWGATQGVPLLDLPYWTRHLSGGEPVNLVFALYGQVEIDLPGDIDLDGDVDFADYSHFQTCVSGDGNPYNHQRIRCHRSDLDVDDDVDRFDFAMFLSGFSGPVG
jgi:hypothetical protein